MKVSLKNIGDCVGRQDELIGNPLDPTLFWLDNIFKRANYVPAVAEFFILTWQKNPGRRCQPLKAQGVAVGGGGGGNYPRYGGTACAGEPSNHE
jgi:hypothetical protein